jgi:hypothetical protein
MIILRLVSPKKKKKKYIYMAMPACNAQDKDGYDRQQWKEIKSPCRECIIACNNESNTRSSYDQCAGVCFTGELVSKKKARRSSDWTPEERQAEKFGKNNGWWAPWVGLGIEG